MDSSMLLSYTKISILILENCYEVAPVINPKDWKEIVIGKKSKSPKITEKNKNPENTKLLKIEKKADNDELKHDKITKELRTKIQQGRASKGLTQKQLANNVNLPLQKIQEIENGKAIYNHKDINKIKRYLSLSA